MSFLSNILGSMQKPPAQDKAEVERRRLIREAEKGIAEDERQQEEALAKKVGLQLDEFLKGEATIKKFLPMTSSQREVIHRVASRRDLIPYGFGEEGVDRCVVVFKKAVAPKDSDIVLMDRSQPYEICMEELRRTKKRLADEAAADRERSKANAAAPRATVQYRNEKIAKLVGDTTIAAKPKTSDGYGIVPQHLRADKRSLEEVERDLRAKRARKANS